MNEYSMNTKCVQAGYTPGNGEPRQIPIVQSTTFKYDTSEDMGRLFDLEAEGYFYTRLQNPTNDMVAAKIAALEGGRKAAEAFMKQLKLAAIETHVADARTCCLNPATSTHRQMTEEQLLEAGIPAGLVRISCGLEDKEDLIADISQALDAIQ